MKSKKGSILAWFFALLLVFFIAVAYFAFTQPFRFIDDQYSPKINFTKDATMTNHAQEVINKVRLYWVVWPVIIIAFIILWAFFSSLKQDPNHPYL